MGLTAAMFTNINTRYEKVNFVVTDGVLTIDPAPLAIESESATRAYNGAALTMPNVAITGLVGNDTLEAEAYGSQLNVGSSWNRIRITGGTANLANYRVVRNEGTLTVTPVQLTVTTGSGEKVYDGTALTNAEASISGLVNGETATVTATGAQTEIGSSANTYSISWGSANPTNYSIVENLGTLTVLAPIVPPEDPEPPEDIPEPETPLARGQFSSWSLFDLIMTILTSIVGLVMGISYFRKKKEDEDEEGAVKAAAENAEDEDENKSKKSKFFGLIPMIASIVIFIITQDLTAPMTIFDKWSILFALLCIGNGALAYFTRNEKEEEEEETAAV
jgi:hypothetical protein